MSSTTSNLGGGATNYFCYECNRTVSITSSPTSDLVCPNCNGGFLEEYEETSPNPSSNSSNPSFNPFFQSVLGGGGNNSGIPMMFSSSGGGGAAGMDAFTEFARMLGDPEIRGGGGGGFGRSASSTTTATGLSPDAFNPMSFLQNYLQNLRAGGANIQFVVDNNPMDPLEGLFGGGGIGIGGGRNLGDYFIGPGLEQLIQQLAENDPNRYGTPPASKTAVEGLPVITITKEMLESDNSQCAVCKDEFELGMEARQMPCKHIYHPDCILPWLELHNSCPVCRYELPTDDPDYENRTAEGGSQGGGSGSRSGFTVNLGESGGSGGGSQEGVPSPRTGERRFRISFPWPFSFGAEASNANSGSNNSGGNSGSRGNPHPGNEPSDPDLD
ncbi:RING-type E3 ubiquitin transferase [Ranunculus cassubicifolius]